MKVKEYVIIDVIFFQKVFPFTFSTEKEAIKFINLQKNPNKYCTSLK